jgi:LmbE family N-acetylglucosaminyl deacetylase
LQEPWRPKSIYHYIQWKNFTPDFVVDISEHIDQKMAAVMAYASQFYDPNSKAPETPISSKISLKVCAIELLT